jgi:hypothetical protein
MNSTQIIRKQLEQAGFSANDEIYDSVIITSLDNLFEWNKIVDLRELLRKKQVFIQRPWRQLAYSYSDFETLIEIINIALQESLEYEDDNPLQCLPLINSNLSPTELATTITWIKNNVPTNNYCELIYNISDGANFINAIEICCELIDCDYEQIFSYGLQNKKYNGAIFEYLSDKIYNLNVYNYDYLFGPLPTSSADYSFINAFINNGLSITKICSNEYLHSAVKIITSLDKSNIKHFSHFKLSRHSFNVLLFYLDVEKLEEFLLHYDTNCIVNTDTNTNQQITRSKILEKYGLLSAENFASIYYQK